VGTGFIIREYAVYIVESFFFGGCVYSYGAQKRGSCCSDAPGSCWRAAAQGLGCTVRCVVQCVVECCSVLQRDAVCRN